MGAQNNHLNVTVLLSTLNVHFSCKIRKRNIINHAVFSGGLVFIDFLHRFVIDHIHCYYFRLITYSIGENQSCEAKG